MEGFCPKSLFWGGLCGGTSNGLSMGSTSVNEPLRSSLGTPPHLGGESKMPAEVCGGSAPHPGGATAGQGLGKRGLCPPRHPHVGIPAPSTQGLNPSHPSVAWKLLPMGKLEIPRCGAGRGVPVLGKPRWKGSSWGGQPGGAAGSQRLLPFPQGVSVEMSCLVPLLRVLSHFASFLGSCVCAPASLVVRPGRNPSGCPKKGSRASPLPP